MSGEKSKRFSVLSLDSDTLNLNEFKGTESSEPTLKREESLALIDVQPICPRTITGASSFLNKGAIGWGWHGLVAYGSNNTVIIVEPKSSQIVQTLEGHKGVVKKILWVPNITKKYNGEASIQLISGDALGHIIHWDITNTNVLASLQDGNKTINHVQWVPGFDTELILAALHSPHSFIIWDVNKRVKLWKKVFNDTLLSFDFNPFNASQVAFLCPDCIIFIDDFQVTKCPQSNGRKFYTSSPGVQLEESLKGRDRLKKLMAGLVFAETKPKSDEGMTVTECLQMSYHRSFKHRLLLVYSKDIIIIDLDIKQTICVIPIDLNMSALVQVYTARQKDLLYCLHQSGSISVKARKKPSIAQSPYDMPTESASGNNFSYISLNLNNTDFGTNTDMFIHYENKCHSESIRQMKNSKILGIAVDPISEKNICLFQSTAKLTFFELGSTSYTSHCLTDLMSPTKQRIKLLPTTMIPNINGVVSAVKMCKPMTVVVNNSEKQHCLPLLGIGTSTGYLYIFNLSNGSIYRQYYIHNNPIKGLEWATLKSVITYSYSDNAKIKNEVFITNLLTGESTQIRTEVENQISMLKVSPLRQFFLLVFKNGPFELWDLATLTLITTNSKFPSVVALEWSHIISRLDAVKKKEIERQKMSSSNVSRIREYIVFSDSDSKLYHFSVDEEGMQNGIKIVSVASTSTITSLAFKGNRIVRGDYDGTLSVWELKQKITKKINTNRGPIRCIKFAPGKNNLKIIILFTDGLDIWDLSSNQYRKLSSLKLSKESCRIIDTDWANAMHPVFATEDGWIRIYDVALETCSSPIKNYTFRENIKCPHLLKPDLINKVYGLLCMRDMQNSKTFMQLATEDGIHGNDLQCVNTQLKLLEFGNDYDKLNCLEKALRVSIILGYQTDIDLWQVALYYLKMYTSDDSLKNEQNVARKDSEPVDLKRVNKYPNIEPLDTCFDYLMDPFSFQRLQLEQVNLLEWKRGDYSHTQRVVEKLVLLGEMDRAVQLLLETDIDNTNYYSDAIKACLVATIQQTGAAQSTIKLVATNLIANGVQLLCLIGKGLDGCRYLVSHGMMDDAVWLAKSILPISETLEVMNKFADSLAAKGDSYSAVLVLLSQCQFEKALKLSFYKSKPIRAYLLLLAYQHYQININDSLANSIKDSFIAYMSDINMD